jgi:hypothetical protein
MLGMIFAGASFAQSALPAEDLLESNEEFFAEIQTVATVPGEKVESYVRISRIRLTHHNRC